MNFLEVKELTKDVEGWLLDGESEALFNAAKNCKGKGEIVEIGSWKGKSTIFLAKGSEAGPKKKIYAIDPHIGSPEHQQLYGKIQTFKDFKKNIQRARVKKLVIPLVKTSEEVAKTFEKPVEFIFIDGAHGYEYVKLDFELWFPKVINGGWMAFHDTTCFDGPKKLVEKFVYKSKRFRNVRFVDSTTLAEKVEKNTLRERLKNRYVLFLKKIYELSSKLHPPEKIKNLGKRIVKGIH